jgi:hypothetical protein
MGDGLSGLTSQTAARQLPLASASARAIALDDTTNGDTLAAALEVLAPGGRLLAPVRLPLPDHITELARDDRSWLAAKTREAHSSRIVNIDRHRPGMR